jgi:2-dehydro-3-deoxygluconokinase
VPAIVALGECMVEFFTEAPLSKAQDFHKSFGGDSLNTLVAASRLGSSTGYMTKVGDDLFAPALLQGWKNEGIDVSQARILRGYNGLYFISLLAGGQREFIYYRAGSAASTFTSDDLDPEYIASAKVLHITGITQAISSTARAAALRAAQIAKQSGLLVSFDPNLRPALWSSLDDAREAFNEVVPFLDIVLASSPEDTQGLIQLSDPEQVIRHFWDRGVDMVAVKAGELGCIVGDRATGEVRHIPTPKVHVVDTTGAGDAFNGAFLHGIDAEMGPVKAAALGVVTASLKTRGRGAVASMPYRDEVYPILDRHLTEWGGAP